MHCLLLPLTHRAAPLHAEPSLVVPRCTVPLFEHTHSHPPPHKHMYTLATDPYMYWAWCQYGIKYPISWLGPASLEINPILSKPRT